MSVDTRKPETSTAEPSDAARAAKARLVRWTDTLPRLKGTDLVRDANGIAYLRMLLELRR